MAQPFRKKGKGKKERRADSSGGLHGAGAGGWAVLWQSPVLQAALVLLVGWTVYANALGVPFYFDDIPCIVQNPAITGFGTLFDYSGIAKLPILPDIKNNIVLRPVAYLTFAVNHHLHGLTVRGFHLFNIGIHLANALLVYCLLRLTVRVSSMGEAIPGRPEAGDIVRFLPLFGALLFVAHPLQTQAVTYIAQRFTSLVAFWYLATLVLYIEARLAPTGMRRRTLYGLSVVATVLAMKTKESAFTLPVTLALYEWMFFQGSFKDRVLRLLPYAATMPIIPYTVVRLASGEHPVTPVLVDDPTNLVNFATTSRCDYLMTEFGVIVTYLRLLLLPVGQNLDHDHPLAHDFFAPGVILPLALIFALFGGALFLWRHATRRTSAEAPLYKVIAFGVLWFFITLSVESSLIPLEDVIVEHRAYLPSFGFFLCLLAGLALVQAKRSATGRTVGLLIRNALVALTLLLAAATVSRNDLWGKPVEFWQDVIGKSPQKARPYGSLALTLLTEKRYAEAAVNFEKALALRNDQRTRNNLVGTYLLLERLDDARREVDILLAQNPDDPATRLNLATLLESEGRYGEAVEEFRNYLTTADNALVRQKLRELSVE